MIGGREIPSVIRELPASFHHHRLVKPFLALKVVANAGHIGPGELADFAEMRPVKACLGEQFAGGFKDAVPGGRRSVGRALLRPVCFRVDCAVALKSHTAVVTQPACQPPPS
jgi:hypothetical protein